MAKTTTCAMNGFNDSDGKLFEDYERNPRRYQARAWKTGNC